MRIRQLYRSFLSMTNKPGDTRRWLYADEAAFRAKCDRIVKDGAKKLLVISDFDSTISSPWHGSPTSWGSVVRWKRPPFTEEIFKEINEEFLHYHAIEIDSSLSIDVRTKAMEEWWEAAHSRITRLGVSRDLWRQMVQNISDQIRFREGVDVLFDQLHAKNVPILVFSAGIGEVIQEMLELTGHTHANIHVHSNFMKYDENGVGIGWNDVLIHVFNKHVGHLEKHAFMQEIGGRSNAILLGDSPGDAHMSDGVTLDNVLRIGFLNKNVEERLDSFLERFDAVLIDDDTFDMVNEIVKKM